MSDQIAACRLSSNELAETTPQEKHDRLQRVLTHKWTPQVHGITDAIGRDRADLRFHQKSQGNVEILKTEGDLHVIAESQERFKD